jgi:hypothetical protein
MSDMICPDCMGALATTDGKSARCRVHGGTYRVLFWRGMSAPAVPSTAMPAAAPAPMPGPDVDSPAGDAATRTLNLSPGEFLAAKTAAAPAPAASTEGVPMCYLHRTVPAAHTCNTCGLPICTTCEFAFPVSVEKPSGVLGLGDSRQLAIYLCPRCAAAPRQNIDTPRKKYMMWSYGLAVWSTFALLMFFVLVSSLHTKEERGSVGTLAFYLIILPSLTGTALGTAAIDRRLVNPFSVKVPAIWNGVILGIFILLIIVGLLHRVS